MTKKRTEIEQEFYKMQIVIRTATRLKYRLLAEDELNDILPRKENNFNDRIQQGELPELVSGLDAILNAK